MAKLGLRVVINSLDSNQRDAAHYGGQFDWLVRRNSTELSSVVQNTEQLAPVGPRTSWNHRAPEGKELDLMPFEKTWPTLCASSYLRRTMPSGPI